MMRAVKRALDILASASGLLVLLPVLLATAILVKATSKGPVFYKQERVGRGGRPFFLLKFRSMVVHADRSSRITPAGDARVTAVGRFLRRTNLDELPQLWNVLRGELSIVGPRPEVPEYVDLDDARWQQVLSVRPGMTSPETVLFRQEGEILAQYDDPERAYREEVLPRKLELAQDYVAHWSLRRDLRTVLATGMDIIRPGRHSSRSMPLGPNDKHP